MHRGRGISVCGMSDAVLFDGWCGKPIAWCRVGDPVIGQEWTENRRVAVTERLTPEKAVQTYGPVTEVVVGRQGGFQSVTYGTEKFVCRFVDPRGSCLYDDSVVKVNDPVRDNHECPACGAEPGCCCTNDKGHERSNHRKRSDGRTRWEIERAEAEARAAREKAEAALQWEGEMSRPPEHGSRLELKRWKWSDDPGVYERVQDTSEWFTVERTYANRTVLCNEKTLLARNEYTGDWFIICGVPTSARLPCRNSLPCRTSHKPGVTLHEGKPWL